MNQPYLHAESVVLLAPLQAWSAPDGQIAGTGVQGIYCGDDRIISRAELSAPGHRLSHILTSERGGPSAWYQYVVRTPDLGVDPQVTIDRLRTASTDHVSEQITLTNASSCQVSLTVRVEVRPDATPMGEVKAGAASVPVTPVPPSGGMCTWSWRDGSTVASLCAPGASIAADAEQYIVTWRVDLPGRGSSTVSWRVDAADHATPFGATSAPALVAPDVPGASASLQRLLTASFCDLNSLRMAERNVPEQPFLAAGAPWFFTLFGRDSLIAARLLLPYDYSIAESTLRVLAARQGTQVDVRTAQQPGKILHEVRRVELDLHDSHRDADGVMHVGVLPPEYYGTIDATPLWILLLADAHAAGMPLSVVRELEPALDAALGWLRDHADADGDGFLEYFDESGSGLANQGWKDSGDSIRWADGTQAEGPIALAEVQGYAYAAAVAAASLLDELGRADDAVSWRGWADAMQARFREQFWVSDELGRYPALALDATKRPVDGVASNMGHLLGTGIVSPDEARVIVERLLDPSMFSGYGVRTLSTTNRGYWPIGYHVGSVWSHDTAVIIDGMLREGFTAEAATLAEGLLRAGEGFGYRLPELFGGLPASEVFPPQPYPASCRPQAWAAAGSVPVARALCPDWLPA